MSSRRLTASEKQEVVDLYRQSGENATELADRFGVSNSTIGRILKTAIPEEEFDALLQAKRRGFIEDTIDIPEVSPAPVVPASAPSPRTKPRISRVKDIIKPAPVVEPEPAPVVEPAPVAEPEPAPVPVSSSKPLPKKKVISSRSAPIDEDEFDDEEDALTLPPTMDAAEFQDVAAELSHAPRSLDDEDLDDDDDDFDEEEDLDDDGDDRDLPAIHLEDQANMTVRPFREASLPRVCYLVIDRSAELVAPPLREFAELGSLSSQEADIKTLPVFDNHRVAKRFSNSRTHRVIKVPDSQIVNKTIQYLVAKGITRMLLDGQVYSLN
jgi:transposase-like protein